MLKLLDAKTCTQEGVSVYIQCEELFHTSALLFPFQDPLHFDLFSSVLVQVYMPIYYLNSVLDEAVSGSFLNVRKIQICFR